MAFKTNQTTTGGAYLSDDLMFINADNSKPNGYDTTTLPPFVKTIDIPNDYQYGDGFGYRFATGNGRIVISSPFKNSNRGCFYIYDLEGNQLAKITAADGLSNDRLGTSLAINNNRIVVGATGNNSYKGALYLYDLNGNLIKKITQTTALLLGYAVSVGDNRIVTSSIAMGHKKLWIYDLDGNLIKSTTPADVDVNNSSFGTEISIGNGRILVSDPTQYNNSPINRYMGATYVYDLNGNLINKLSADLINIYIESQMGTSISVGSGRIASSAPNESNEGVVYLYDLNGNLIKKINSPTPVNDYRTFGASVVILNGRILISKYDSSDGKIFVYDLDGNLIGFLPRINSAYIGQGGRLSGNNTKILSRSYNSQQSYNPSIQIYNTLPIRHTLDLLE